jgi:hypothetical protein
LGRISFVLFVRNFFMGKQYHGLATPQRQSHFKAYCGAAHTTDRVEKHTLRAGPCDFSYLRPGVTAPDDAKSHIVFVVVTPKDAG